MFDINKSPLSSLLFSLRNSDVTIKLIFNVVYDGAGRVIFSRIENIIIIQQLALHSHLPFHLKPERFKVAGNVYKGFGVSRS